MNSDECNFIILISQCGDKKFEDVKRWTLTSGWEPKGVWGSRAYSHKSWGKSTDAFNIEKGEIHLKHESRGKFWDISGWNSGDFFALVKIQIGQGSSNSARFSGRPSMSPFIAIRYSWVIETWPKHWWISWERVCFESPQTVGTTRFLSVWGLILTILSWK